MFLIQKITTAPLQKQTLFLEDGTTFSITLYFQPMQQCWLIQNLTYLDFVLNGLRLTSQPNLLFQWANKLPFGLFCLVKGNREPSLQQDFASGNARLFVLNQAEKDAYTEYVRGS